MYSMSTYWPRVYGVVKYSFFFKDTATTEIYTVMNTLSLHDALPISRSRCIRYTGPTWTRATSRRSSRSEEHTSELESLITISYAVFCLKKKRTDAGHDESLRLDGEDVVRNRSDDTPRQSPLPRAPVLVFFFNDTATTEIYTVMNTLSLHDALPISTPPRTPPTRMRSGSAAAPARRSEEHTSELQSLITISYAVFCLKKKKKKQRNKNMTNNKNKKKKN